MLESPIHRRGNFLGSLRPDIDDLVVALSISDRTHAVLLLNLSDRATGLLDDCRLFFRNNHVIDPNRHSGPGGRFEAKILQLVEALDRCGMSAFFIAAENNFPQLLLSSSLVDKTKFLGPDAVELYAPRSRFNELLRRITKDGFFPQIRVLEQNPIMGLETFFTQREINLIELGECHQSLFVFIRLLRGPERILGDVVATQRDVLTGCCDRTSVAGSKDVVWGQHKQTGFQLSFDAQGDVYGHLIAVEVRIVCGTYERMNPDRVAFDKLRFKSLNRQTMQGRGAVKKHWMFAGHFVQCVPDNGLFPFDHLFRRADGMHLPQFFEAADNKRFKQNKSHLLRQSTLVELELRTNHDDGTSRVIHPLAEKVHPESSGLPLQHVRKRL